MEHHHHHSEKLTSLNGVYIFAIALNMLFVVVEAGIGFSRNSLGLVSDAGQFERCVQPSAGSLCL